MGLTSTRLVTTHLKNNRAIQWAAVAQAQHELLEHESRQSEKLSELCGFGT